MLLEQINQVNDIKKLNKEDWEPLAQEIRDFLIEKISVTGGHLASNLGVVEPVSYTHLQHIGEQRRELNALKHPSVDVEGLMAFRQKAVVDSLTGNMLVHPLTTPVIEVDENNRRARSVWWSMGVEGLSKHREAVSYTHLDVYKRQSLIYSIAKYFAIAHIHEWIEIKLMYRHTAFFVNFIILEFTGICSDLLMRYVCIKTSMNSVRCNRTNPAFIGTIFSTFMSV